MDFVVLKKNIKIFFDFFYNFLVKFPKILKNLSKIAIGLGLDEIQPGLVLNLFLILA